MVRSAGRGGHPQPVRVAVEKAIDFLRCDDTFRGSFRGRGRGGSAPSASFQDASRSLRGASRLSPPPSPKNPSRSIPSEARDNSHPVRAASPPSGPAPFGRQPVGRTAGGPPSLRDAARGRDGPRKRRGKSPCGRNNDPPLKDSDSQGERTAPYCAAFPPRSLPSREDPGTV